MTLAALDRVSFQRGPREVLRDATLHVAAGERVGLVGPNGAGKSTVLRLLLSLEKATAGRVTPCGAGAGYVPQGYAESLFPWFSVLRNVAMPRLVAGASDALDAARGLCARVLPGVDLERSAGGLSGGEKQTVAVARALLASGSIVVADEPFSALGTAARTRVRGVMAESLGDRALVLVSHAVDDVADLCHRVLRVEDGHVSEVGATS